MASSTSTTVSPGLARSTLGWDAYESCAARQLGELDEVLFEVAHLWADFPHADGTVLITDALEVLGFCVEIAGELPEVTRVARALDARATQRAVSERLACDRTVISGAQNLDEHRGLPTNTE
jgi:hypothetical protein